MTAQTLLMVEEASSPKQMTFPISLDAILNINDEIRQWEEQQEQRQTDDDVLTKLSDLYLEKGDVEKAKEYAVEALRLNKECFGALANLGYLAYLRDYEWFGGEHFSRRADYYLGRMIGISEHKRLTDSEYIRIADLAHVLGKKELVKEYTNLSLETNPKNIDALVYTACVTTEPEEAEKILKKALEYEPTNILANHTLVSTFWQEGKKRDYNQQQRITKELVTKRGLTNHPAFFY